MIYGAVNARLEAKIKLILEDGSGQPHSIEVAIDTAYSGYLTLPSAMIVKLAMPWLTDRPFMLGDGTTIWLDVYLGNVIWDGQSRSIEVTAVEADPLIGMKILAGHEVRIRVIDGGMVWIDHVP